MTTLEDLKLMNDTLINYYNDYESTNEKKILKHKIIQEVLNIENCFNKITKNEALALLKDLGITASQIEIVYSQII